jgi:hypothetical protein
VDAIFPSISIILKSFLTPVLKVMLPKKKSGDNVKFTPASTEEYELALANLTLLSPFIGGVFPENRKYYRMYTSFDHADENKFRIWKKVLYYGHFKKPAPAGF